MAYENFLERIDNELLNHSVITNNKYCNWFRNEHLTLKDVRYFTQQFSVFSNQFTIAQLNKVINAGSLEEMHDAKEILMNELGVIFRKDDSKVTDDVILPASRSGRLFYRGSPGPRHCVAWARSLPRSYWRSEY